MGIRKIPNDTEYFHYYNANPKNNRSADCVVRAIATALDKSWDDVLDDLIKFSHKYKLMPNEKKCYNKYLESIGFKKCKQLKHSDGTKYSGVEFIDYLNETTNGPVIAHIGGHHLVAIKKLTEIDEDGWGREYGYNIYDTWNSVNHGVVGNFWVL